MKLTVFRILKIIALIIAILVLISVIIGLLIWKSRSTGEVPKPEDIEVYRKRANNIENGKFYVPYDYYNYDVSNPPKTGVKLSEEGRKPDWDIPVVKTDLMTTSENPDDVFLSWLGHSSVFLRMENNNIMIDPIFSSHASPVSFFGVPRYSDIPVDLAKIPMMDIVIYTHDHYDHLDYKTATKLNEKTKLFIVPLGVEKHLMRFGIDKNKIVTMAWFEEQKLNDITITFTPTVHHSGRFINSRWTTLFGGYVLENSKGFKIYDTGDSGFGSHFNEIRKRIGRVDVILTDNGQYNEAWHVNHMFPEEAYKAAEIMEADYLIPVHIAAYSLSPYPWNDALMRLRKIESKVRVATPKIGELINLKDIANYREEWWIRK